MPLKKNPPQRLELGQMTSPNIHKPSEPKNWDTINIHKLESIETTSSEPKTWDTIDVTKYS